MINIQTIFLIALLSLIANWAAAEDAELTMEIIESLDNVSTHHRLTLPSRSHVSANAANKDALDVAVEKVVVKQGTRDPGSNEYKKQREQLNALILNNSKTMSSANIANADEVGQNGDVGSDLQPIYNGAEAQETIAGYRKEMIERRQELINELIDEPAAAAGVFDSVTKPQ